MLRLSVTDLEGFRYWKDSEDADMVSLLARLSHTDPPTPQMAAGRALAKVFEHATTGELDAVMSDGWEFRFNIDEALSLPAVRELKAEVVFETPTGPVTLVGKVDGLYGVTIHDQKLTEKFDAERYLDSLQWRAYLTMLDARAFIYDVFVGSYDRHDPIVTIREYHRLPFYTYPDIRLDVQRAVNEMAEVVRRYFPQLDTPAGRAA